MTSAFLAALADFHFLRPLALVLLLAVPLFWLAWRHARSDAGAWRAAVDAQLLPHLIERVDGGHGRAGVLLATALWTLAVLALAGPAWERQPMPLYRNQAARVLVLELSPTMLAQDEKPSRLARARYKLDDILARSRDMQTALIGYGADAFVAAPLTDDVATVTNLVDALDPSTMPVAGNATARAIDAAVDLIAQAGLHRGQIVLLADSVGPDAAAAAAKARARGLEVSVLGVGTPAGAPVALAQGDFLKDAAGNVIVSRLDESGLRAVAEAGGGRYASLTADAHDLDSLLGAQPVADADAALAATQGESAQSARWRDRGPWLLLLLVPLALAGFRRGWLLLLMLALSVPLPRTAQAAALADLWQRPDQQAAAALARGDAKQAAQVARSPNWRGSGAYRAGDYKAAADAYARSTDADGAYNRGNALAKMGRYEDAIAAYDEALKRAPGMDDALHNRQAVEDFLKQSKSKSDSRSGPSQDSKSASGSKDGQEKSQQSQQSQDAKDSAQQGQQQTGKDQQDKDQQAKPDASSSPAEQESARDQANNAGKDDSQDEQSMRDQRKADAAGEQGDKAQAESSSKPGTEQQKALSREIDQALAGKPQAAENKGQPRATVPQEDAATSEKKQALEHLLQRVPDDPGGLLRRKFQLEYQRRQDGGNGE